MPTNRLFSSKIRLFLVLLVLYDVGQVFANFEVRLKPNCEMEQDSTVKTMTTGACSHTQAVIMEGDARLLINVASPTSLKFSTVYLRNLTPEATTIKFENTVDLEHVLGEACKFKKEKFTAFADWHMVYVSAICKNAQGKSVHAFVRSIVYSEYLIHTPPSYVVYTNIPESSDLAGVGALTGYRETARLIEYNNKLNKSMIFVRLLNNVNSTTPVQTHPSLFDNTTEAADTPVGEITKIINVGLTEANAGQITVYMTTKNDGYFVTSRTFLDKPLKLVDRDDCATKNPLSGDITAYFCFKDEFEKEKGKEVYKWRSDLILNDVLMPDLSYECGNTQAGVDFEKCKSDVAKRSFWCILLFVLAGIEFLIITATMLTFVGCICHRRRKIKKHRKRKGRHGKNKKKEDSNGSKASNTKKTGSAESAVSNADTKNTTNDKNTTSEAKK
ncbi:unnamed protein product [Bursaphelenchus okinawaensis]|uniref:ZP domain-containing protein n=1 Tax=Bursaphelenchus okinawaensis TaxID=465554 RepID=A0A811L4B3_9BILA|nr:unnamed protein product [Bursaphelenchus okinawaensis]CAG9119302.1 unnamed protein product [Bursaphelenchus okinawaensis]